MNQLTFDIRTITRREMDIIVGWAEEAGTNPGLFDAGCFHAADPNGFFLATADDVPAGCIAAITCGDRFGFLGCRFVQPPFASDGVDGELVRHALTYLNDRIIGIDATEDEQALYEERGFSVAHTNVCYTGKTRSRTPRRDVADLTEIPFRLVAEYDVRICGYNRHRFLSLWVFQPRAYALGIVREGGLAGYGVIRSCRQGYAIGPLFADSEDDAEHLLTSLAGRVPAGEPLMVTVPAANAAAITLARQLDLRPCVRSVRMYAGGSWPFHLSSIYALTSTQLG